MKLKFVLITIQAIVCLPLISNAQIQWEPHPIELNKEIKDRVRFGFLPVPENRNNPDSREIYMAFTVIESVAENPLPDPVISFPGGIGVGQNQFVNAIAGGPFAREILQKRDLILIDVRGSGYSHPRLCDNLNSDELRTETTFVRAEERQRIMQQAFDECADRLTTAGAEVTSYNSVEISHDVEDLRQALGYEQWNLRGHSYGTRHGMAQIQEYPHTVRSAALSGMSRLQVYSDYRPVYIARSLQILFDHCRSDRKCNEAYPYLEGDFISLLQRVEKKPIPMPIFIQNLIGQESSDITPQTILSGLFIILYVKSGIEITPAIIHQLAEGKDWIAQNMSLALANQWSMLELDINFILGNNDRNPDFSIPYQGVKDELAELLIHYMPVSVEEGINTFWPQIRGSEQATTEIWELSDVPVLLISGELDPVTPPTHGNTFTEYFIHSAHHTIPGSGHYPHADAQINFAAFFDNPDPASFDIHAHMMVQPLRLVTDVTPNRGISTLLALAGAGMYQRFILPGIAILFCLIGFAYFPVRGLVRRIRKKPGDGMKKPVIAVWIISFLTLIVVAFYAMAITDALSVNPYILAIGLPSKWAFIRIVIVVLAISAVYGLMNFKPIWQSSAGVRIPALLSITGGFVFCMFVFTTGMF